MVLILAGTIFMLIKPLLAGIVSESDYWRRIGVWTALTGVAFLSPSYWIYVVIAAPMLIWAGLKDSNPLALYVTVVLVIPPMEVQIPTAGLLNLFSLDQMRLLGLLVLLPVAVRELQRGHGHATRSIRHVDLLLLAYGFVHLAVLVPYESFTNTGRRAFLFVLDTALVYYVFSRAVRDRRAFQDVLGALFVVATVMAAVATFESLRHWLLYARLRDAWNTAIDFTYLLRGSNLRAQASTGHALSLGLTLALALGSWFHLKIQIPGGWRRLGIALVLLAGLYVTYSRGPWLTAILIAIAYFFLERSTLAALGKPALVLVALTTAAVATPLGSNVVSLLPFVGSAEQDTIAYRAELAAVSWQLILQNPWFGDPFVLDRMGDLRQGQDGIIDLVNAYAGVALFNGVVGLFFYVFALLSGVVVVLKYLRSPAVQADVFARSLGACLVAWMLGLMMFMGFSGFNSWQWPLLGLACAYGCWIGSQAESQVQSDVSAGGRRSFQTGHAV